MKILFATGNPLSERLFYALLVDHEVVNVPYDHGVDAAAAEQRLADVLDGSDFDLVILNPSGSMQDFSAIRGLDIPVMVVSAYARGVIIRRIFIPQPINISEFTALINRLLRGIG